MQAMQRFAAALVATAAAIKGVNACERCESPQRDVLLTRNVRRMQPDAQAAVDVPNRPLEWGALNVLHTTDTHGWLEGHLKESNYGADWGDFRSFTKHMRKQAKDADVDLLIVDTGDLHDGAGLSDATYPNGVVSNPIFDNVPYDLLTIGNHELYLASIASETFANFSKYWGDKYLTSNVQIRDNATGQLEYIGKPYRYFTTPHGLRIMAFGFLYDFTGNTNTTVVTHAADVVKQQWFSDAVNFKNPIDLFVVLGHNPVRATSSGSTFGTYYNAIRNMRPDVPIQVFGGHTHIRDFYVFPDGKGTALESGRYCETLGWFSMSNINAPRFSGKNMPNGLPHPNKTATVTGSSNSSGAAIGFKGRDILYSRRYLDWNKATFEYHSTGLGSKDADRKFDTKKGDDITKQITADRKQLNLTSLYGCAPQTWCISCAPYLSNGSIFSLLQTALSTVVVNETRKDTPRLIIINTGSVRFDLPMGPFTYDDSFIVSPFTDSFQYIPNVPYSQASQVLNILNKGPYQRRDALASADFGFSALTPGLAPRADACVDPPYEKDESASGKIVQVGKVHRRQQVTPGYTTKDDFGTDGDDTVHSRIPYYSSPNDLQANASFPTDGSKPDKVDMIFLDFISSYVVSALNQAGGKYTAADVMQYLPMSFTTNSYLPAYAKQAPAWQKDVPNCPVGAGIGSMS